MGSHQARVAAPNDNGAKAALAAQAAHAARQEALGALDCMRSLPASEIDRLADLGTLRAFAPGAPIMTERRLGDFLYVVLRGTVSVTLHDRDGREVLLGVLDRGDCCGEGPLFGDFFRRATVYAERPCNMLQLPLDAVRELLPEAPHFAAVLRRIYRERLSHTTLGRVPLFNHLSHVDRTALCNLLRPSFPERGAEIVRQGTAGNALFLIESGQVVIEQNGQPIAHLTEGGFFGEMSLLEDKPHNATVRALTPTSLLALPADELRALLSRNAVLAERLKAVADARHSSGASAANSRDRARHLTLAVQHGMLRGTHMLVRTPELCPPGCRICEGACATRHGLSRLHINGTAVGKLDVLNACRQCRVGAECVEACPESALTWDDRGALIVNDKCTGCGKCVSACPYDAIAQPDVPDEPPGGPMWQLYRAMRRLRHPTIPLHDASATRRAAKCDLCHGHDDLACLTACPTGSLRLVPVEEIFPL
jgi:CRP-like cAMP-binding protein/Fe-S-cluster-containing hydrogenase component 2